MSPEDARRLVLRSELQREWEQVETFLERARSVVPSQGPHQAAFVALALDHSYQAFESLLLRLEKGLALPMRGSQDWNRALLADAGRPIKGLRPSVLPAAVEGDWEELLRFRHFLRHAYAVELDAERLRTLVIRLASAVKGTAASIQDLLIALE